MPQRHLSDMSVTIYNPNLLQYKLKNDMNCLDASMWLVYKIKGHHIICSCSVNNNLWLVKYFQVASFK